MAKQKMIPSESHATEMVPADAEMRPLTAAQVAELETKQQMKMPLEEPFEGRKSKVNMSLHSGTNLVKGKVPKLTAEDVQQLRKNFPGDQIKKILEST